MVFWQYIFSPVFGNSDVIISHVTTKLGMAIKVNEIFSLQIWITYVKQKESYGKLLLCFPPVPPEQYHCDIKVARSPAFSRSTNLESKLIEFFVFVKF